METVNLVDRIIGRRQATFRSCLYSLVLELTDLPWHTLSRRCRTSSRLADVGLRLRVFGYSFIGRLCCVSGRGVVGSTVEVDRENASRHEEVEAETTHRDWACRRLADRLSLGKPPEQLSPHICRK